MNNEMSFDDFKEQILAIYADGDLDLSYKRMLWYITNITFEDKPLTAEFLIAKFKQHIDQWNLTYGSNLGTKWFPTRALSLRKTFYDFLGEDFYKREFTMQKGSGNREIYLFGTNTQNELKKQFIKFKDQWDSLKKDE